MDTIFIMAAGDSTRWKQRRRTASLPDIKQLAPVMGVPLITRTMNQLRDLGVEYKTTLVTRDRSIIAAAGAHSIYEPPIHEDATLLSNILATHHLWRGTTAFLLGDVAWSNKAIERVVNMEPKGFTFFGAPFETFALVMSVRARRFMTEWLRHTIRLPSVVGNRSIMYKLRDLRWIIKFGRVPQSPYNEELCRRKDRNFVFAHDWTMDVDHERDYNLLLEKLRAKEGGDV